MSRHEHNASRAPWIPRTQWPQHRNYPAHVLLLGSHANFLRISRHLIDQAHAAASAAGIERLYNGWIRAMRSHEAYEEYKLYPYLARRWGVSFAHAEAGHRELHERDDAVRSAFASDHTDALTAALEAHDATLQSHLRLEEELVIPLLLELSPREFTEYTTHSLRHLMQRLDREQPARDAE